MAFIPYEDVEQNGPAAYTAPVIKPQVKKSPLEAIGGAAKAVGNFFTSSEQGLGKDISKAITASGEVDQAAKSAANEQQYLRTLLDLKHKAQENGGDVEHWDNLLANFKPQGYQAPEIPSTGQVALDAAGTTADILSAGTYGSGKTAVMKTGELAVKAAPTAVAVPIQAIEKASDKAAEKSLIRAQELAVNALDPRLKGTKAAQAYSDIVNGQREVVKGGIIKRQGITAAPEVKQLATRLGGLIKTSDPIKNLESVGRNLLSTESRLDGVLNSSQNIVANIDKPSLLTKLDAVNRDIPREFAAVKESRATYKSVSSYARRLVDEGTDTVTGLREIRKAFDRGVKTQYPNAFKGGYIDIKTPAGLAIKHSRDALNEHLYDIAPRGSEIRALIRREADLYKAADLLGPKAAETHGKSSLERVAIYFKDHPIVAGLGLIGAGAAGASAVAGGVKASGK